MCVVTVNQYEVTIKTGDEKGAGCNSPVFLKVFGVRGATDEMKIDKIEHRFDRGRTDVVKVRYFACVTNANELKLV